MDNSRLYLYCFVLILIIAASIRLIGLDKGIWCDEHHSISQTYEKDLVSALSKLRQNDHPPLYFLMLNYWSRLNSNEPFLRLLSVVFGMGFIIAAMEWLKSYNHSASLLSGLYLATAPMVIRYAQEIRGYALLMFATALAFYFAAKIIRQPQKTTGYVGVMISLAMAVSTHLIGIFLLIPIAGYVLFSLHPKKLRPLAAIMAVAAPAVIFIFFYSFYLKWVEKDASWWIPSVTWAGVAKIAGQFFFRPSRLWSQTGNDILLWCTLSMLVLPAFWWKNTKRYYGLALAALLYWLQIVGFSLIKVPVLLHRTALPGVLPFIGFITLQICAIPRKTFKTGLVLIYIFLCCNAGAFWLYHRAGKPNEQLRAVSNKLASQWQPGDKVVFLRDSAQIHVRYYFNGLPTDAVWYYRNGKIEAERSMIDKDRALPQTQGKDFFSVFFVGRISKAHFKNQYAASKHTASELQLYYSTLNSLEERFGPPVYQRWFRGYVLMEFAAFNKGA